MGEFIFLNDEAKVIQKKLNQWKHDYDIQVVTSQIHFRGQGTSANIAIMIWREPLNQENKDA
jgi:hypothetical protein